MEDFSPRQSPRVKDYLLTQTTNASPARLNTHGSTYSGYGSNIATEHPSYIELKRDYAKALNTIEILRLEKSNLETALKYAKRSRPGDSLAGSYTSAGRRSPDRREYRSDHYAEVERRVYDLKQELEEHKKLLADNFLYTENLKREAHSHHNRLQEIDDLQSRNYLMRDEMNALTRELQIMTNKVADFEEERHQLLDKISADGQQRFPPRGIYKYVDYIYNAVDTLPTNHHAYYHFQECFPDNENMEILIEEKDSNTLILQTFKYLTNLLVNLSSNPTTIPSTLPVSSDSKGNSLNLMDKVTPRINGEATPLNQSVLNASRSQRKNAEQAPTRKESSNNVSRSRIQQQVEEEEAPVPRSPSRLNLTNMSNHTRKKSLGSGPVKATHNTQPSFGDGVREHAGVTTPNPNPNLSHRSKAGTPTNRSNISMNKSQTNRPKTNLDVSQRNNSQIGGALNRSGYSSASPKTDRRPSNQRSVLNVQPAADVSRVSQNRSRNRIDATPQMLTEQISGVQYERELLDRENRLRELDRELAEKERLLQGRGNQNERHPTEVGTAGFGTQASTHEEEKLIAYHSNSRYIDHHRSGASSRPAQTKPQSNNDLNNRSHISNNNNPSRNQSIRQDTREALDRSNLRDNLNQSHHSAIPNRVIPSITTITDFDGSPKAGNNQTPHNRQDQTRKVISPFVFSSENIDAINENDRAGRSPAVGKCRIQSRPSIPDETTPIPMNNRVSFQVYSQAGNSPYSRASGWPQTQDKLDQSTANRSNIRIRDEYHTSHLIDQPAQRPSEYADYQEDDMRRKITFEQQQYDDDENIDEDPQQDQDEELVSPNHMSLRGRNTALRQKGTEYASFRVSFGRTESKDMRNGSPPPDQKGSLFVFDIPKRKRVTHNEQTYDIVKGKTVNYKLKSEGKDYQINLAKSRTGTRTSTCSDFQSVLSDKPNSPTPSIPVEAFKEAL